MDAEEEAETDGDEAVTREVEVNAKAECDAFSPDVPCVCRVDCEAVGEGAKVIGDDEFVGEAENDPFEGGIEVFTDDFELDGFDLWQAVLAGDTLLGAVFVNYGDEVDPNYFINSITYDSVTLENEGAPSFSPWWSQWVSGGESGYPEAEPIAFGIWDFGSGMSDPYRVIVPFATDAYVFGDGSAGPTSAAPIPEPAAFVLLAGALLCLVARRNRAGG